MMRAMDSDYFRMLSSSIKKAAEALSKDREKIEESLEKIVKRQILKEVEETYTDEQGKTKTRKKQVLVVNDLDNILPQLYMLSTRSGHLRDIEPRVFHDMIRVQANLRVIERARKREKNPELYLHPEAIFLDFLQGVIHQILKIIVPGIARDITLPVIPLSPPQQNTTTAFSPSNPVSGWKNQQ